MTELIKYRTMEDLSRRNMRLVIVFSIRRHSNGRRLCCSGVAAVTDG